MNQFEHTYDDQTVELKLSTGGKASVGNVNVWAKGNVARCDALGALRIYGDNHIGAVRIESEQIVAKHAAVAALSGSQAREFGLPESPHLVLLVDASGVIGTPNFRLTTRWLYLGRPIPTIRCGAFLKTSKGIFLIHEPLFSAIELADSFDASAVDLRSHWTVLAEFRNLFNLDMSHDDKFEMSEFLKGLRIMTGAALSLALDIHDDVVDFDPVLYDKESISDADDLGRPLTESDGFLTETMLRTFQCHPSMGFRAFDNAKKSYLLDTSTILIVDEDLETALQVVREKQQAGPEERRAFAANPRAEISKRLVDRKLLSQQDKTETAAQTEAEDIESLEFKVFIETPEYADRAIGIGLWEKPDLDLLPHTPNVWLPETFPLELDGVWLCIDSAAVKELRALIDDAIEKGVSTVNFQDNFIPASIEVRDKLAQIITLEKPQPKITKKTKEEISEFDEDSNGSVSPTVAIVHDNFVEENWSPVRGPRSALITNELPRTIKTKLFKHQQEALNWQIQAWKVGHLGVLNADDQGLGKTIQTIAFLAWLQENMSKAPLDHRLPFLIVAPKGLLGNWDSEVKQHLTGIRLGSKFDIYGRNLKSLRKPNLTGFDTDDGKPRLNFENLLEDIKLGNGHKNWLLTTYETLTNYQHSFRQIHFSVVVFDEIQKIKNIKTLNALAARGVRADFRIGLTGTPIENHIGELWAILDALAPGSTDQPGRLGTLSEFLGRYEVITEERMRELHGRLFKPVKNDSQFFPPVALRRLKEDELIDLPRKDYRLYPTSMSKLQADAYESAREYLFDGTRGSTLKLLHHLRGTSLHPISPETVHGDIDAYFEYGARFSATHNILERIRKQKERVLIFTEDRRMQSFVAQWLRSEFALQNVRIINGETTIRKRVRFVEEFQRCLHIDKGFDVMILSPRASGLGLTLTAATHVIHLSRWWNPAVEEQCNDRIYRIGQACNVTVHVPLAIHPTYREASFDCVLNNLMRRKTSLARAALWPPTQSDYDNGMLIAGICGSKLFDPTTIDALDWLNFENWVMDRAKQSGDWEVSKTPQSADGGADAILRHRRHPNSAAIIQAKHTTTSKKMIADKVIHEILKAKERYKFDKAQLVVITNARGFTDGAMQLALDQNVKLVDRDRLGLWPEHILG